jgi:hypothetical protein
VPVGDGYENMNPQSRLQMNANSSESAVAVQTGILRRKYAGDHGSAAKSEDWKNKNGALQRRSSSDSKQFEAPPIVREVLNSSGRPLDVDTRSLFETRFAHNFSSVPISQQLLSSSLTVGESSDIYEQEADRVADSVMLKSENEDRTLSMNGEHEGNVDLSNVRIHTDSRAAESARAVNSLAYTVGNNIVFGAGQFAPQTRWGQHLLAHELTHVAQQNGSNENTIQRKKVPTGFGEFETTAFTEADGRGVDIILLFHPDETKVDAKKIALSQSLKATNAGGSPYAIDPSASGRMVGSGKAGAGYYSDTISDLNNPLYAGRKLGATEELKDTPESENTSTATTKLKDNTRYRLGHCYKEKPADAAKKKQSAGLWDQPKGGKNKGESKMFETAALAIEGTDKDKYYGSVKWGYKMEGTTAAPTVTKEDITLASKEGEPSANFLEPAKLWNKAKTRGTLQVTADPEATVLKGDGSGTEKLAKDTKLKQLSTVMWGTDPAVNAEVLKADGTGSGKVVYIKQSDVKDVGDGLANKKLPIPAVKPAVKK